MAIWWLDPIGESLFIYCMSSVLPIITSSNAILGRPSPDFHILNTFTITSSICSVQWLRTHGCRERRGSLGVPMGTHGYCKWPRSGIHHRHPCGSVGWHWLNCNWNAVHFFHLSRIHLSRSFVLISFPIITVSLEVVAKLLKAIEQAWIRG